MFMKLACAYLEGQDRFAQDGLDRKSTAFIDPRVRPVHICLGAYCMTAWAAQRCSLYRGCLGWHVDMSVDVPLHLLQGALNAAHQHTKVPGSATACVMQLDQENGTLEAANLVRGLDDQGRGGRGLGWGLGSERGCPHRCDTGPTGRGSAAYQVHAS